MVANGGEKTLCGASLVGIRVGQRARTLLDKIAITGPDEAFPVGVAHSKLTVIIITQRKNVVRAPVGIRNHIGYIRCTGAARAPITYDP